MKSPWDNDNNNKFVENFLQDFLPKDFFNPKTIISILAMFFFTWLASGIYSVDEGTQAIVTRFGAYNRKAVPGLNYRLPSPIESVIIEKVDQSRRIEIGYRSYENKYGYNNATSNDDSANSDSTQPVLNESIMLTGDENILYLNCDVVWHIKDLKNFLFNAKNPSEVIKLAAESAIREVVGRTPLEEAFLTKKQQVASDIQVLTQEMLDMYNIGVEVENIQLLKVELPTQVISYYRDVQKARDDKGKEINKAQTYMNEILPKARGDANKIVQEAAGYKEVVIARAEGQAQRFIDVLKEYNNNKQLTKDRLYFDSMDKILSGANKIIMGVDALPHMPIVNKAGN